jgi:hypothetical protein
VIGKHVLGTITATRSCAEAKDIQGRPIGLRRRERLSLAESDLCPGQRSCLDVPAAHQAGSGDAA